MQSGWDLVSLQYNASFQNKVQELKGNIVLG